MIENIAGRAWLIPSTMRPLAITARVCGRKAAAANAMISTESTSSTRMRGFHRGQVARPADFHENVRAMASAASRRYVLRRRKTRGTNRAAHLEIGGHGIAVA